MAAAETVQEFAKRTDRASLDDATLKQIDSIEKEIASVQELIGNKDPIQAIEKDYQDAQSLMFLEKAKDLSRHYKNVRKIRGDGNCFYRALLFAQFEVMVKDKIECKRFVEESAGWKDRLLKLKFPDFTTEDFCDTFVDFAKSIEAGMSYEELLTRFRDESVSNYLVVFCRLVASGYLKENADFYQNFVAGEQSLDSYCAQEVEPMFKECDHLTIQAACKALGLALRIEYMDQSQAPAGGWFHEFAEEGQQPKLFFLYRHDHYDILYKE